MSVDESSGSDHEDSRTTEETNTDETSNNDVENTKNENGLPSPRDELPEDVDPGIEKDHESRSSPFPPARKRAKLSV
jgi:hypothetical protein